MSKIILQQLILYHNSYVKSRDLLTFRKIIKNATFDKENNGYKCLNALNKAPLKMEHSVNRRFSAPKSERWGYYLRNPNYDL